MNLEPGWQPNNPGDSPVTAPHSTGIAGIGVPVPGFLCGCWAIEVVFLFLSPPPLSLYCPPLCVCEYRGPWRSEEGAGLPEAGVTGGYELPNVRAGT